MPDKETEALYERLAQLNNRLSTMQREIAKKNAALTRLLEDRAEIAAMAAHDLRTPLQVIMTGADVLENVIRERGEVSAILETIRRSTEKIAALADDLLLAYSGDIGKLEISLRPVELSSLVRHNTEANRGLAMQKRIALQFTCGAAVPAVLGDPLRLEQVLDNLVTNAIKFSPAGSTIAIDVSAAGSDAIVTIQDQGGGLTAEQVDALLRGTARPAQHGPRAQRGYGLGVTIARTIVEKHHGTIEAESQPGQGLKFRIRLPLSKAGVPT